MSEPSPANPAVSSPTTTRRPWLIAIALLIAAYLIHSIVAVSGKSSTYDEPIHTLSSWLIVNDGDFRVNPEHPALWKYVAGLGLIGQPLHLDLTRPAANAMFERLETQWWWGIDKMYRDPAGAPLYGERLVWRARIAMTLFGLALALVVARWAWAWGGPLAAVVATALLAFDPNFLAHTALVANDVAATFLIALATYLCWRLGERFTWGRAIAFSVACAAGLGIKFTCLLLAPMLGIPLLYRALVATPWPRGVDSTRAIRGRFFRFAVVVGVSLGSLVLGYASLWPMYQFRQAPTQSGTRFDDHYVHKLLAYNALIYERRNEKNPALRTDERIKADIDSWHPGPMAATLLWLNDEKLVPQAWGYGINYANARSYTRVSYLMGRYSDHGFLFFFPLAIAFKTPMTTLALAIAALLAGLSLAVRRIGDEAVRWKLVCLLIPPAIYFAVAMSSTLNIGLRHVLPVYPPVFVAIGVMMAKLATRWRPLRKIVSAALVLLAIETCWVFPNYLTFFNAASGGPRGGLSLLSDSNLDWGQDLPALADWYRSWRLANPNEHFYFAYHGTADPRAYGIDFINALPGYLFDRQQPPEQDLNGGVYALSATYLQGLYPDELRDSMARLRSHKDQLIDVINNSIYIYTLGPSHGPTAGAPATQPTP